MTIVGHYCTPKDAEIVKACIADGISCTRRRGFIDRRVISTAFLVGAFAINLLNIGVYYPTKTLLSFTIALITLPAYPWMKGKFFAASKEGIVGLAKSIALLFQILVSLPIVPIYPKWVESTSSCGASQISKAQQPPPKISPRQRATPKNSHPPKPKSPTLSSKVKPHKRPWQSLALSRARPLPTTPARMPLQTLSKQSKPIVGVKGLKNEDSASCFMNAVLQIMVHIPALRESVISQMQPGSLKTSLENFLSNYQNRGSTEPIATAAIRRAASQQSKSSYPIASSGRQEDAHEFLQLLMSHKTSFTRSPLIQTQETDIGYFLGGDANVLHHRLARNATFLDHFSLPITPQASSLSAMMEQYFVVPHGQNDKHFFMEDKAFVVKETRTQLCHAPELLPIYFKRFANSSTKLNNKIDVPKTYTLPAEFTQDKTAHAYALQGFIVHIGAANIGHYVAYFLKEGKWYCANDTLVTICSETQALQAAKDSYMTFYTRQKMLTQNHIPKQQQQKNMHKTQAVVDVTKFNFLSNEEKQDSLDQDIEAIITANSLITYDLEQLTRPSPTLSHYSQVFIAEYLSKKNSNYTQAIEALQQHLLSLQSKEAMEQYLQGLEKKAKNPCVEELQFLIHKLPPSIRPKKTVNSQETAKKAIALAKQNLITYQK